MQQQEGGGWGEGGQTQRGQQDNRFYLSCIILLLS